MLTSVLLTRLAGGAGDAGEDLAQDFMWKGLKMAIKDDYLLPTSFRHLRGFGPQLFAALHADKTGERFFHCCAVERNYWIQCIIGVAIFSIAGRYVAFFLMVSGHAGFILNLVWESNSFLCPPAKRAAAIGIVNEMGNIGNLWVSDCASGAV
ncbi:hypothetical protein ACEPAF_5599 [Sanghuangporus sanghuang]